MPTAVGLRADSRRLNRMALYDRDVDDIKEDVYNAKQRRGATVLLGAGASKSAGVPLAGEFCAQIKTRFQQKYRRAEKSGDMGYQSLMAQLSVDQRRELLSEAIDAAKINWAHIALAGMIRDGYVTRVLTPNFDPLVVQACALLNVFPSIYDFAASSAFKPNHVGSPAVFYLHGQRTGFRLLNTQPECEAHADSLRPVFDEAGQGRPWIVVGYSGQNDPVFDLLLRQRTFDGGLYWVTHQSDEPGRHLTDDFLDPGRSTFLVRGHDADSFFMRLADRLGCFPPDLVRDPFGHLQETYDRIVVTYPKGEDAKAQDILQQARDTVKRAAAAEVAAPAETDADDLTMLRLALATGDYDRVIAAWKDEPDPSVELSELAARALTEQGIKIGVDARRLTDPVQVRSSLESAIAKYAEAVLVNGDSYKAFNNWGDALSRISELEPDAAVARAGFEAAIEKLAEAVKLAKDHHYPLNNWGLALNRIARLEPDRAMARSWFEAAADKYRAAAEVKPDDPVTLQSLGATLSDIAQRTAPEQAAPIWDEAERVLKQAVALKSDDVYNLACLYALTQRHDEARALLLHAREVGMLPDAEHLRADADLAALQNEPWFQDLLVPPLADE